MKKYICALLLAFAGVASALAEDVKTYIVVEFKTSETLTIALSDKPKAQFEGTDLLLTAATFEGRYATADIKRFYFEDIASAIKTLDAAEKTNGNIYDLNGRQVSTFKGNIDSTTLPAGVYVIKTESGKSFKVTKK